MPKISADQCVLSDEDKKKFADERQIGMTPTNDPVLNDVAKEVRPEEISSPHIKEVIRRMFEAAKGQRTDAKQKRRRTLVGLAAPQIGEPLRIVIIDTEIADDRTHHGSLQCFINPIILWRSRETDEGREGCFSAGPVWGLVRRSVAVKIRGLNEKGETVECILEGFQARIAQHEIDHLSGIRFPDRIRSDQKRHWVHAEELQDYAHNYRHWPRKCPKSRWEEFKTSGL